MNVHSLGYLLAVTSFSVFSLLQCTYNSNFAMRLENMYDQERRQKLFQEGGQASPKKIIKALQHNT